MRHDPEGTQYALSGAERGLKRMEVLAVDKDTTRVKQALKIPLKSQESLYDIGVQTKARKESEKHLYTLTNYNGHSRDLVIEKDDIAGVELMRQYALFMDLDIIQRNYTVKATKKEWGRLYNGLKFRSSPHEFHRIFLDIDQSYSDNADILEKALQDLGVGYDLYESATGNIHVYIHITKTSSQRAYKQATKALRKYLAKRGINVDISSLSPLQGVYLEGFRIMKKGGRKSVFRKHVGAYQTTTAHQISKRLEGYSIRYGMRLIRRELRHKRSINLSEISREYGIPQQTLQRALERLTEGGAITYTSRGSKGVRVESMDRERLNKVIHYQRTRKQYWHMVLNGSWCIVKPLSELLQYTKRMLCTQRGVRVSEGGVRGAGGVQDGTRGSPDTQSGVIPEGERNNRLWRALVRARYEGRTPQQVRDLAWRVHERMERKATYKPSEVEAVIRWALRLQIRGSSLANTIRGEG